VVGWLFVTHLALPMPMSALATLSTFGILVALALVTDQATAIRDEALALAADQATATREEDPSGEPACVAEELQADHGQDPLPEGFQTLLKEGQLLTAVILATKYEWGKRSDKGFPQEGGTATVKLPNDAETKPKLLKKLGNKNAVAMLWQGGSGDKTVYIAFTPARGDSGAIQHFSKIQTEYTKVVSDVDDNIGVHAYLKRKFDVLWSDDEAKGGLKTFLAGLMANGEYADYRFLFCGLSHGAALTQLATYRFARTFQAWNNFYAVSWNSYLWTDAAGAEKVHNTVQDHLLNLVASQRSHKSGARYWDPSSTYSFGEPQNYVAMKHTRLLETGCWREASVRRGCDTQICGNMLVCDASQGCPGTTNSFTELSNMQFQKLHFAQFVMRGMKEAMKKAR